MVKTTTSPANSAEEIARQDALKKRAAKQAAKREIAPVVHDSVECTVLLLGDGKISMGEHVAGLGEVHYEEGETFQCVLPNAVFLAEKGWVTFEGAREAIAAAKKAREADALGELAAKKAFDKAMEQAAS